MTLLSLPTALLFTAMTVPLLVLLYFLKLKRREQKISSTLLWKKAIEDLRVNAPFQKLRRNLLLFLQLLVLAAALFALANPVINVLKDQGQNLVLLIDRSGSMNAIESDGRSRLEHAKQAASDYVAQLPKASRAMVIAFADRANVVSAFTSDSRRLQRAIEGIEPTTGPSMIGEALQLAVAYSSSFVEEAGASVPRAAQQGEADIQVFSDGRLRDADKQTVNRGKISYYKVGEASDNVGIVAFDVRRDFERPGILSVFAQIENFGPTAVKADVSLELDSKMLPGGGGVREVNLGPAVASTSAPARPDAPQAVSSSQNVIFELQHTAGGVLSVTWHRPDALMSDNQVVAPLDPPRPLHVLAVTNRSPIKFWLGKAAEGMSIDKFEIVTGDEYESMSESRLAVDGRSAYDLVIFDLHSTQRLPPGNYVFFGGAPKIAGIELGEEIAGRPIVFGRENHPLMRAVNYDSMHVAAWKRLTLPKTAVNLLEGEDSVVMAHYADPGHQYVLSAFDLLDSYLPFEPAFPILLQNIVMTLAGGGVVEAGRMIRTGEAVTLSIPPGAEKIVVRRPDATTETMEAAGKSSATLSHTMQTGLYRVDYDNPGKSSDAFAVNLLDENESRIVPNPGFVIGTEAVSAKESSKKVNQSLWPTAAAAALALVLVEWWIYNRRVMI